MGKIKINLNAIKSGSEAPVLKTDTEDTTQNMEKLENSTKSSPEENLEKQDNTKKVSKINLSSIKVASNNDKSPIESDEEHPPDKDIITPTSDNNIIEKNVKNQVKTQVKTEEIKSTNNSIKNEKFEEKDLEKKEKNVLLKKEEKTSDNKKKSSSLFKNYESIFQKEKTNILEHVKKLKNLPKTNIIFLSILVSLTIAGITMLFHINPEVHSLKNYKTSLIDTYNAVTTEEIDGALDNNRKERVTIGGYIFNTEIKKVNGKDVYIYKGKYFQDKTEMNKYIENELKEIKKSKIAESLKNSFLK